MNKAKFSLGEQTLDICCRGHIRKDSYAGGSATSMRSDGNNVDPDREMLDLVTNQLRYNALVQVISDRFAKWRKVINERG